MQQFKALWLKELGGYFQSSFAYMILFIYMFVSVGGAFYFGSYLALHDPSVYALFYLQPIVLTALLPAVTMRLWSEEYKSGTAEYLLTQPLEAWQPVAAKFAAATVFGWFMSLLLLPFIFFTAQYLTLDWGSIVCSYIGLALFVALFCALGAFVSALNKNIIVSYLLTVFFMALVIALPITKLYESYTDFLLAEIGFSDMAYFVLLTAVFVFLNILVLEYRYSAQKNKTWRFAGFSAMLLAGTVLFVFALDLLFAHKFDLSAHNFYTPQPQTRKLIAKIDKPISIDVYIAKDFRAHNVEYFRYYQQVKRFLEKYRDLSGKMIRLNVTEVEPFSQMEDVVLSYGLYYEENASGTKDYFGAVVRDNDAHGVTIKQFTAERGAYLEKDIDSALLKLTDDGSLRRSIGVYLDPTQNLEQFNGLLLNLEEDYNIVRVDDEVYELSPNIDMLILINPKLISTMFRYALDQYIMNGGKVVTFFDLVTKNQTDEVNLQMLS
ncbi:MAG: Gldg family protein, partial [Alphaproteobacteria bacterium]|nr:Gldg family protein [Alphaproteobacteria bacterium]